MRTEALLSMALLVAACRTNDVADFDPIVLGPAAGPTTLVREAKSGERGGYDLFRPTRPTVVGGSLWVVDVGNDQLVRFDSTLARASSFAREGEGPGEIEFPQDLLAAGDRLIVVEAGNGRISTFDTTGVFRSTLPTNESPRFIAEVGGKLISTLEASPHYAYAIDDRGRATPHAAIPDFVTRLAASDPARYPHAGPSISGDRAGRLFVLDQSVLALTVFDPAGALLSAHLLPEPYRSRLLEQRLSMLEGFGKLAGSFMDVPVVKRITVDREGRLLVLFPLPDSWGLLVDTGSWTARPLLLPDAEPARQLLWAASDATLDGDRLYVVSGGQLYQFAVEGWR